jgi:tetratricopeptide (TPR) repeat protein
MRRLLTPYSMQQIGLFTLLALCLVISATTSRGQQRRTTPTQSSAELQRALALGDFYYKNGDITDRAAVQYRRVRDSAPKSSEGATAQYYLGSYYHRKFYIQKEKKLREDIALLVEAQGQYEDYAGKFAWNSPSPQWLSDAYFNLALVFLQRGDSYKAEQFLGKVYGAAPYDSQIYIYQVIWTPNSKDVIDKKVDARELAKFTNSLVYEARQSKAQQQGPPSFDYIVERIKRWAVTQK